MSVNVMLICQCSDSRPRRDVLLIRMVAFLIFKHFSAIEFYVILLSLRRDVIPAVEIVGSDPM